MTVAPSVATNTLHVTYDPRLTDRGDLYVTFRGLAGFELVGLYESYLFVRFETPVFAALALCKPRPTGVITYEAAKHRYTIPYPQPQDDNDGPCAVLHITHMPAGWTQVEMTKIFQLFDGFVRATFHEKYSYCHFLTHEAAARARKELRCSTNLVVSFAKVFKEHRASSAPHMESNRTASIVAGQLPRVGCYQTYSAPSLSAYATVPPRFHPRHPYIPYELAPNGYTTPPPYDLYSSSHSAAISTTYRTPTHTIHRAHSASALNHMYRRQFQLRTPPNESDEAVHDQEEDHLDANTSGDSILVDLAAELDTMSVHEREGASYYAQHVYPPNMPAQQAQYHLHQPPHHYYTVPTRKGSWGLPATYLDRWSSSSASSSPLRSDYQDYDSMEREIVYGHHKNMQAPFDLNLHAGRMRYRKVSDPTPVMSKKPVDPLSAIGGERAARMARMSGSGLSAGHLSPNMMPARSAQSVTEGNGSIRSSTPGYLFDGVDGRGSSHSGTTRSLIPHRQPSMYANGSGQAYPSSSRSSSPSSTSSSSSLSHVNGSNSNHHNNSISNNNLAIKTLSTSTAQPQQLSASSSATVENIAAAGDLSQTKQPSGSSPLSQQLSSEQYPRPRAVSKAAEQFHALFSKPTNSVDIHQAYGW
ncbi:hypothetical protein SeLEV6574_g01942 [Synchytrium endobioticum]|nr:hypothetical protein SeLEV6574_g01942 [Synchytrium endobioticum]